MYKINSNFLNMSDKYLFSEIRQIKDDIKSLNKDIKLIDMSIGDVTLPLDNIVIDALHNAVDDMGDIDRFRGYSPEQGYLFLREAIKDKYSKIGVNIELSDIFVNDGSKSDLGNILDIFSQENIVGLQSICYPVYVDACNISGFKVSYIKSCEQNNFLPMPEDIVGPNPDLMYLCSPNNPTGMAYNKFELQKWVNYAKNNNIIVVYDSAYQDFIIDKDIPYTVYQIDGASECFIEICSLSKSAGFTGIRCGYTIIPSEIKFKVNDRNITVNELWSRRQATKFNGVSYLSQRAACTSLRSICKQYVDHCRHNSKTIRQYLDQKNMLYWGGINSPYIWLKCPRGYRSQEYFKYLINNFGIVTTTGVGFGEDGEGFIRISTFFR